MNKVYVDLYYSIKSLLLQVPLPLKVYCDNFIFSTCFAVKFLSRRIQFDCSLSEAATLLSVLSCRSYFILPECPDIIYALFSLLFYDIPTSRHTYIQLAWLYRRITEYTVTVWAVRLKPRDKSLSYEYIFPRPMFFHIILLLITFSKWTLPDSFDR